MDHVQDFKTNFPPDEMITPTCDAPTNKPVGRIDLHEADSAVRNLCLVWEDGRRAFFNYAYLVSVDLIANEPFNVMMLYFSGHVVTLKGYQLGALFDLLVEHTPRTITAKTLRYYPIEQIQEAFVTEIWVKNE